MGQRVSLIFAAILGLALMSSCVSRRQVRDDYDQQLSLTNAKGATRPQTLVFFLMDGFSVPLTQKLFVEGRIPTIKNFFLRDKNEFLLGRATFPSLTHVNISSILSSRNVDVQPIMGNKIFHDGKVVNFESPFSQETFSALFRPYSIFNDLKSQGRSSMSFAPYYGDQATARYGLDLKMGLAYRSGDYAYVDHELLQSMSYALRHIPNDQWPEFIFVHIVGIDGTAHHYGRLAQETQDYAVMIDGLLGPILEVLQDAATHGRQIGAVMTSDHGMSDLRYLAKIDKALYDLAPGALLINQGRLMGINFAPAFSDRQRADALNAATRLGGVGLTVGKTRDGLTIYTQTTTHTIRYATSDCGRDGAYALSINNGTFYCPSELNKISEQFFYPYFATNIAAYFRAKDAPDALVLASEETSFGDNLHAHHGGLTPDEIRVPLLFWNLEFKSAERLPQTFRLLEGFRQPSETSVKDR